MEYDRLDLVEAKAEKLLDDYRSDSDIAVYTNAMFFLVGILIIAIILLYIYEGYGQLIYSLALLSLIPYKIMIGSASEYSQSLSFYKNIYVSNKIGFTTTKLKYLKSLIVLKLTRVRALRIVYMCCFPVLLYVLSKLFVEREIVFTDELIYAAAAILIGTIYWYFYFKNEIQDLELDQDEIKSIISSISL